MENMEEQVEAVESSDPQMVAKPNPDAVLIITAAVVNFCNNNPEDDENTVLFLTTLDIVRKITSFKQIDTLAGVVFAYYLEAYRILDIAKQKDMEDESILHADYKPTLYTDAALSLFDVYLAMPEIAITRRLVALAASSLHQVITAHQSSVEDAPIENVLSDLADIALLTQTVREYVKGRRRVKNYPYISLLKTILKRATSSHDLSFIQEGLEIKDVIAQVKACNKIIIVT